MTSMTGNMGPRGGNRIPEGYELGRIKQFTPQQEKLFGQMFEHAGPDSYLSRLASGDQSQFDEMEAPAKLQFSQSLGQLGSRFSQYGGPGSLSSRGSSGFKNEANQSAMDFAQQLQANRQNLQRQAIMDLRGLSSELLGQRPYEQFLTQKQEKEGINWGGLGGAAVGGVAGFFAGGPMGAVTGAGMGYNVGSGLSGSKSQVQTPNMFSMGGGGGGGNYGSQGFQSHAGPHYNFPSP